MNYPQEKYNEVRIATGYYNMSNETIDRILLSFATVPQVTLEEAVQIRSEYYRRVRPEGIKTVQEIMQQVVNSVLAKQGPVIVAKPEPTVTLVDAAKGRTLEVPASAVHEMEYPEASSWLVPETFSQKRKCVSVQCMWGLSDKGRHTAWHGRVAGK
jgi:hypothetical protein